jgi:hypothetical protein
MTTLSETFEVRLPDDDLPAPEDTGARGPARPRARIPITLSDSKWGDWGRRLADDLRSKWYWPESLPRLGEVWATRIPDRSSVPGENGVLYAGWLVYNHTFRLAVPVMALIVVGAATGALWIADHPARFLLAASIVTPLLIITN